MLDDLSLRGPRLLLSVAVPILIGAFGCSGTSGPAQPSPDAGSQSGGGDGDGPDSDPQAQSTRPPFTNPITPAPAAGNSVVRQNGYYYTLSFLPNTTLVTPGAWNPTTAYVLESTTLAGLAHPLAVSPIFTESADYSQGWAPDMKYLKGPDGQFHWYVYQSAQDHTGQRGIFILRSNTSSPMGAWTNLGYIPGSKAACAYDPGILQMPNGTLYLSFAFSPTGQCGTYPAVLGITKMTNAETTSGTATAIAYPGKDHPTDTGNDPSLSWEHKCGTSDYPINEAPAFLVHNNTVSLVYDANNWETNCYVWGLLTASTTGDLTNPSSWTKHHTPVFQGSGSVLSTGNHEFFTSPDGTENWAAYNVLDLPNQVVQHMNAQKFTFNTDGTPSFGVPIGVAVDQNSPSGEAPVSSWHTSPLWYDAEYSVQHGTHAPSPRLLAFGEQTVGGLTTSGSYLRWNHVNVPVAGSYPMIIQYSNALFLNDIQTITINGGSPIYASLPADWSFDNIMKTTVTVDLHAGDNIVQLGQNLGSEIDGFMIPYQEAELSVQTGGAATVSRATASQGLAVSLPVGGCAELDYKLLGAVGGGGFTLAILYSTAASAGMTVSVNGSIPRAVPLPSTGAYDKEGVSTTSIGLSSEGMNTLRLCGSLGTPQVDGVLWY